MVMFIPKYFILFDVIVNWTVFLFLFGLFVVSINKHNWLGGGADFVSCNFAELISSSGIFVY